MAVRISVQQDITEICRKKVLWNQLCDCANYPILCAKVNSVRILESSPVKRRSEWFITIGTAPFSWMQVAAFRDDRLEISSEAVSGDFAVLRGLWKITDIPQGKIRLSWTLDYELDVPVLDVHYGTALRNGMHAFAHELVTALVRRAATLCRNERLYKRVAIDRLCSFTINGNSVAVRLAGFSRGGISFTCLKEMPDTIGPKNIEWNTDAISAGGRLLFDSRSNLHRIAFNRPLAEKDFKELFFRWSDEHECSDELIGIYDVVTSRSTGIRIHSPAAEHTS